MRLFYFQIAPKNYCATPADVLLVSGGYWWVLERRNPVLAADVARASDDGVVGEEEGLREAKMLF